ncbi:hypothetical protein RFI02_03870 [Acinetobacter sichuanensis]|uniref:hypothetical protein n=1 Tax=Acinetobacter sichuanensis TaxID=2136183 RepID=UPI00280DDFB5|nr:hypothetical protein [Acinetobacter sichuanensis]MDQ9020239.1 hypothetical protein [Acinetobacter sichuanensis]
MNYETELKALVEEAYSLFSSYSIGEKIEACCGHYMTMEDCELLLTLPLAQIDQRLISQYLFAAESTDVYAISQQMKYLLPRILESLINNEYIHHCHEDTLTKCHFYLDIWTDIEFEFMQRFALCYFQMQLMKFTETTSVTQHVLMFHLAGLDIRPLLIIWEENLNVPTPMLNLIQTLHYDFEEYGYDSAFSDKKMIKIMNEWLEKLRTNELLINALVEVVGSNDIPQEYQYIYDSAFDQLQITN